MIDQKQIGEKVKALRLSKDCSQQELANVLLLPRTAVTKIEAGERALSSSELIQLVGFS